MVLDLAAAPRPPDTLYRLDVLRAVLSRTAHDCEALVLQAARLCSEGHACVARHRRSRPTSLVVIGFTWCVCRSSMVPGQGRHHRRTSPLQRLILWATWPDRYHV